MSSKTFSLFLRSFAPVLVLPLGFLLQAENARHALTFTDVTEKAGLSEFFNQQGSLKKDYILETTGGGAAFIDYNNDGRQDLLLVGGSTMENLKRGGDAVCRLYKNNGDGTFTDVTTSCGLTRRGWGQGVCVADYDNDGYDDIYITCYGPNILFRNNGDGTFTDVTEKAGVGDASWSVSAAFGDYDNDGHVDLYVCNYVEFDVSNPPFRNELCTYKGVEVFCGPRGLPGSRDRLYRNNGDGTFTDVTEKLDIDKDKLYGLGVEFCDIDNDGDLDIFVANDLTANLLYINNGDGTFTESALLAGVAYDEDGIEEGSMGVDFGDYDNDGWMDLYYTNSSFQTNTLARNNGNGTFANVTWISGHGDTTWLYVGWGTSFVDFDNDGWVDLFVVNGHLYPEADRFDMGLSYKQRILYFRNDGNGKFSEIGASLGKALNAPRNSRGAAFGDYDNDGDIDVLINNLDDHPTLLRNDGGNSRSWLIVKLVGTRGNRNGIGARIQIKVGDLTQVREIRSGASYASHNDMRAHFGLGDHKTVSQIKVRWPSGAVDKLENVEANKILTIREGAGLIDRSAAK